VGNSAVLSSLPWAVPGVFGVSLLGAIWWRGVALKHRIVAVPNERTLHSGAIPRGGGIVIATVWLAVLTYYFLDGSMGLADYLALFAGGAAMAALGLIDDVVDIKAPAKLAAQILIVAWGLYWIGGVPAVALSGEPVDLGWIGTSIGVLGLLWGISLYNFMDGIDGMAGAGAIFISLTMGVFLALSGQSMLSALCFLLACACAGFLWLNWPPARLFMGDAGSGFLGYVFGIAMFLTVREEAQLVWVWLITMGYFITDTTTTLLLRMLLVRKFYGTHRHHAYQSLARRTGDHRRVTVGVLLIEVLWLLPFAIAAYRAPELGPWFFAIAVAPLIAFCAIQGTLHEL
jgi:Fuc2NAc and GlcNAc transferase